MCVLSVGAVLPREQATEGPCSGSKSSSPYQPLQVAIKCYAAARDFHNEHDFYASQFSVSANSGRALRCVCNDW